ncbi:MAG: hypothetical protein JXA15_13065 [Spirochaetales bacterium]|nr:hypothetical protein [Spirochaetales bacterium]
MTNRPAPCFEDKGDFVVIHAPDSATGVPLEYEYLEQRFGQRDRDWKFVSQRLMPRAPDGWLDLVEIELADGTRHEARFDITQFYFLLVARRLMIDTTRVVSKPLIPVSLAKRSRT